MASTLKVDQIETPSGVGNISFAQPISGDGSQLTGVGLAVGGGAVVAGDFLYHDGVEWTRLPKGTAAQYLRMNAGATAPEWIATHGAIVKQATDPTPTVPATPSLGDMILNNITGQLFSCTTETAGAAVWTSVMNLDKTNTWTKAQRGEITPLVDAANIATDFNDSNHFSVTLTDNRILDNPTNLSPGQTGSIFITQDATGGRTLSFGTYWMWAGGGAPSLSTGASLVDRLDYIVISSSSIHGVLSLEIKV
tara:strand:- start:1843 stop:2595 length:753 start_codon:yes stop_codon:yes gene_type:complete